MTLPTSPSLLHPSLLQGSNMAKNSKSVVPYYVHYGLLGGAACSCRFDFDENEYIGIATYSGSVFIYSAKTLLLNVKQEDPKKRVILNIFWHNNILYIHYRGCLTSFRASYEQSRLTLTDIQNFGTDEIDFCFATLSNNRLFIPNHEKREDCTISVFELNADQAITSKVVSVGNFSGKTNKLITFSVSNKEFFACGFENGSLRVIEYDEEDSGIEIKAFNDPVFNCDTYDYCIAVSTLYLHIKLYTLHVSPLSFEAFREIPFPSNACGCASLKFSMDGKLLASGYCDGTIRIHSVKRGNLRFYNDFHSAKIKSLNWCSIKRKRMIIVCSTDEKVSIWNLYDD